MVNYQISATFTEWQYEQILSAMRLWSDASGRRLAWQSADSGQRLYIAPVDTMLDLPYVKQPNSTYIGITSIGDRKIFVVTDDGEVGEELFRPLVAHELGHYLGIQHSPTDMAGNDTCMLPSVYPSCLDGNVIPEYDRESYCKVNGCSP